MMPRVTLLLYKLGHNCEIESTGGCQSENIDEQGLGDIATTLN